MNEKLALSLRDAGYPQGQMPYYDSEGYIHRSEEEIENWVYEPSLSELIEACGDGFPALQRSNMWRGTYNPDGPKEFVGLRWFIDLGDTLIEGETPEEAVAVLWMSINKKPLPTTKDV